MGEAVVFISGRVSPGGAEPRAGSQRAKRRGPPAWVPPFPEAAAAWLSLGVGHRQGYHVTTRYYAIPLTAQDHDTRFGCGDKTKPIC
jgi:hypothetical protein